MNYPTIDVRDLCQALGVEYNPANSTAVYLLAVQTLASNNKAAQQKRAADVMPCGHPQSAVVQADEGTAYCSLCEASA